jgi:hypothetical protein
VFVIVIWYDTTCPTWPSGSVAVVNGPLPFVFGFSSGSSAEGLDAVAPVLLGDVEGAVGVAQQGVGVAPVLGQHGDADAHADRLGHRRHGRRRDREADLLSHEFGRAR